MLAVMNLVNPIFILELLDIKGVFSDFHNIFLLHESDDIS